MTTPHNPSAAEYAEPEGKPTIVHDEKGSVGLHEEDVHEAAARGHAATDAYGELGVATTPYAHTTMTYTQARRSCTSTP